MNIITAPEIEMLIICNEEKYVDFKKLKLKLGDYCKSKLRIKEVKNCRFVKS